MGVHIYKWNKGDNGNGCVHANESVRVSLVKKLFQALIEHLVQLTLDKILYFVSKWALRHIGYRILRVYKE